MRCIEDFILEFETEELRELEQKALRAMIITC